MIRVLHIGPDQRALGGIASVLRTYTHCPTNGSLSVGLLATVNEGNRLKKLLAAVRAYARAPFEIMHADVVHVHTASRNSWRRKIPLVILARLQRRKLVIHIHGGGFAEYLGSMDRWRLRLNVRLLSLADCVVCLSASKRNELASYLPVIPMATIPNPCRFGPGDVNVSRKPGVEILFAGLIDRQKGVFDLIRALALVTRKCPGEMVRLVIAGEGKADACRRLACECGVEDKVFLPGWLSSDALREAYAQADIYCLPSYVEGMPMGILEAMAFALPVVATRVGGIPDVVEDGVHGLLVQPGDVDGLAIALKRLMDDGAERAAMGAACRRRVLSRYSPEQVGIQLAQLYRSLMAEGEPQATLPAGRESDREFLGEVRAEVVSMPDVQSVKSGQQQRIVSDARA
jgi:glycosyltransferase involved in cell wall biosynthesis